MTQSARQKRIYRAAFAHLSVHPYLGIDIAAATDAEAADKAMKWALDNASAVLPQTWLQVTLEGAAVTAKNWKRNNAAV